MYSEDWGTFVEQGIQIFQEHLGADPQSDDRGEIKMTNLLLGCLDFCPGGISKPSVGMPS